MIGPGTAPRDCDWRALGGGSVQGVAALADSGWEAALAADPALAKGLATHAGSLRSKEVADAFGLHLV